MDSTISAMIVQEATRQGIDPQLALAVANHESGGNQSAIGAAGEIGIFQLLPSSFPGVAINVAQTNIQAGIAFLRQNLAQFGGDVKKGLAAYNWGPPRVAEAVAQYGADWFAHIPGQVQGYVAAVEAGGGIVGSVVGAATSIFGNLISMGPDVSISPAPSPLAPPAAAGISWMVLAAIAAGAYLLFSD